MTQNTRICMVSRFAVLSVALVIPNFVASHVVAVDESSLRYTKTVQAIQQAEPAVVNIEGNKPAPASGTGSRDVQQVNGMGAGVIVDARGYILTNQHVVQDVGRIEVTLHNQKQYVGRLIARDASTDLALVKIDARGKLPVIRCGTSSDLMRGEPVIAIGNPFGYHHTVTLGIISALHRDIPVNGLPDYPNLIQTDASINPGNSGGPLLNAEGAMIGINAAVRIGAQGIGFAIPVDRAMDVAADMIARHRRGAFDEPLKVRTEYDDGKSFVTVVRGVKDGAQPGDVVSKINGRSITNRLDYELALTGYRGGSKVEFELERSGKTLVANFTLGKQAKSRTQLASTGSVQERAFRWFGIRLEPANPTMVQRVDPSYKGGLRVTSVRQNSPAYVAQIQPGDVLVGLMEWQTPNWEDLDWILKSSEMKMAASPKFHIMRNDDVFWGTLDVANAVIR